MEELIEQNMGLVLAVVNKFDPQSQTEKDDYIQAGRIGLWKALTKFSKNGGSKFSPYAWNPIRWEIIKEIRLSKTKYNSISMEECKQCPKKSENNPPSTFWEWVPSTLTKAETQVIQLRLEGYNFKDISLQLKRHRSQIKKIFYSAIEKIRETNNE